MDPSALVKIVVALLGIFAVFVVMVALVAFGLWRRSKQGKAESAAYAAVASQTGWSFSASAPPALQPYIDHIDKQMFPNTQLVGSPAKNVLANGALASFDYDHSVGARTGIVMGGPPKIVYEKAALFLSGELRNLPAFLVDRRGGLGQAFQNLVGTGAASPLLENFSVHGDQAVISLFSTPEVFAALQSNGIARVVGGQNYLCVFFPRNQNEIPDAERIRYQFGFAQNLAQRLKR